MPFEQVAVLGLGLLGSAVSDRLLGAGYPVAGYDVDPARREAAHAAGVVIAPSGAEAVRKAAFAVTCLPDGPAVWRALFEDGIASGLRSRAVLIDMTTCSPAEARSLAAGLDAQGIAALDAPVSGSSAVVRQGGGVLMVGGPEPVIERCLPLLQAVCPRALAVGPSGAGAATKLVTNLVLGLNRLALAEGLALAERVGLDLTATLELLRAGASYSRAMDVKGERMIHSRFEPEARVRQHLKDVDLILELARTAGAAAPVSALHRDLLARAVALGCGDDDNAAIIQVFRHPAGGSRSGSELWRQPGRRRAGCTGSTRPQSPRRQCRRS